MIHSYEARIRFSDICALVNVPRLEGRMLDLVFVVEDIFFRNNSLCVPPSQKKRNHHGIDFSF
jgi:hypothetical protein